MQYASTIHVAKDFSEAPGARFRQDGPNSGEEFYERMLAPRFKAAVDANGVLFVDLDGTWGYASSFISGSFGRLAKEIGETVIRKHMELKSLEDKFLIETIWQEVQVESTRRDNQNAS